MGSSVAGPGGASVVFSGDLSPQLGTVLVTGACGFIGSHVALKLMRCGVSVVGVDARHSQEAAHRPGNVLDPGFRFVRADVAAPEVAQALKDVSAVIHLAAATDVAASWEAGFAEHASSTLAAQRLLMACEEARGGRVVVASSAHVYGPAIPGGPQMPVRESDSTEPTSPYGVAKLACEGLTLAYARRSTSMSAVALRYFPAFGPGVNPHMVVPRFFAAAMNQTPVPLFGDGAGLHTWTYISDLVEATLRAALVPLAAGQGEVVNAAGRSVASLERVAELIGELVGQPVPLKPSGQRAGDAAGTRADLTRARTLLDFVPRVDLADGLMRQWQQITANSSCSSTVETGTVTGARSAVQ